MINIKINDVDAVEHIINSLDAGHATGWYDVEESVAWYVSTAGPGIIEFTFTDEDYNETTQRFRLVEVVE